MNKNAGVSSSMNILNEASHKLAYYILISGDTALYIVPTSIGNAAQTVSKPPMVFQESINSSEQHDHNRSSGPVLRISIC
jgi:hypothetical protein